MNNLKGQTKRPNKTKNENAITLVALIITIIILIILAAVTINALTHDDLADMAIKGAEDYDKAQKDEMNMLNEIDSMVRDTIKNIEDGTTKPKPDEPTIPTTPDFSETIELANNNIGASIDYQPALGTYSTTIDGTEYSGASKQDFSTSDLTGGWSLWSIDDTNIYVIADNATNKSLTLEGVRGYNNGVTLLDSICDICFTDKTTYPNMKAQNLKLENVLAVKSASATNSNSDYGNTPFSYSFRAPYIWNEYEKTQTGSILNRSNAYPLTAQDITSSIITNSPYSTYWEYNNSWNTQDYWKNSEYFKMVMLPTQEKVYWLSTRATYPCTKDLCLFGLHFVSWTEDFEGFMYTGGSLSGGEMSYAIRPLVSFPMADYTLQENGDTIKIIKRS